MNESELLMSNRPSDGFDSSHLLLGGFFLAMVLLLQFRPIDDLDIFWQVRLGQLMLEHWSLIDRDVFSFTHEGMPVPTIGWLAQVLFALAYRVGDWRGVQIVHVLLFSVAFLVAGVTAVKIGGGGLWMRPLSLLLALLLALMAASSSAMVRPQSFAVCFFAIILYLVRCGYGGWQRLLLIGLIAVLWQNTHPSLAVGTMAVGALALAGVVGMILGRGQGQTGFLLKATLIMVLAQLATPTGWGIFETSGINLRVARDWLQVSEWMPPWHESVAPAMIGFYFGGGFTLLLLIGMKFRIMSSEWAILLVLTMLTLTAARFVVFWAVAMIPLWTRWTENLRRFPSCDRRGGWSLGVRPTMLVALCGLIAVLSIPYLVPGRTVFLYQLNLCIEALRGAVPAGRIFNYREWGGPLILAGHPNWKVAIDGRLYLYSRQDWQDYDNAALARIPLRDLMSKYQPDAFFLHPVHNHALIGLLDQSRHYRLLFRDSDCVAYQSLE